MPGQFIVLPDAALQLCALYFEMSVCLCMLMQHRYQNALRILVLIVPVFLLILIVFGSCALPLGLSFLKKQTL
jgi:hypothetical protein